MIISRLYLDCWMNLDVCIMSRQRFLQSDPLIQNRTESGKNNKCLIKTSFKGPLFWIWWHLVVKVETAAHLTLPRLMQDIWNMIQYLSGVNNHLTWILIYIYIYMINYAVFTVYT